MRNQIFMDKTDAFHATSRALVLSSEGGESIAIFMPEEPEQRLRVCSEIGESLDVIRREAYADLDR